MLCAKGGCCRGAITRRLSWTSHPHVKHQILSLGLVRYRWACRGTGFTDGMSYETSKSRYLNALPLLLCTGILYCTVPFCYMKYLPLSFSGLLISGRITRRCDVPRRRKKAPLRFYTSLAFDRVNHELSRSILASLKFEALSHMCRVSRV